MAEMKEQTKPREGRYLNSSISRTSQNCKPEPKVFNTPMQLVDITNGKTTCSHETLAELSKIEKTLNVVSVVGSLRTGKSFLLNKLAKVKSGKGFEIGHTFDAVTKGVWVLCRPHPTQNDQVLVLLDTEGMDDPDKVEIKDDQWLFILTTLLSSTMVYNTIGNFEKPAIEKFKNPSKYKKNNMKLAKSIFLSKTYRFLREIKTSISVTGTKTDDSILDFFFPTFVLALRDFTLTIQEKTSDVFLEGKLMLQRGQTDSIRKFNEPRQLIRRYFKKRRCFIFVKPTKSKQLPKLMEMEESELKPEFQTTLNSFRDYIFSCEPKTLKSGRGVNGRMLATLLTSYVNSIQAGKSPCLSEAMTTMADVENAKAVDKATEVYSIEMKKYITEHTVPTDMGLARFHRDSMKAAMEILKNELVFDDNQVYEELAVVKFNEHLKKFRAIADKNSKAICLNRLNILNLKVMRKLKNREYCHPAGYDEYMTDINWIIKQYNKDAPYLGTMARASLQEFLDRKETEEEQVYQMVLQAQEGAKEKPRPRVQRLNSLTEIDPDEEAENRQKKDEEENKIEDEIKRDITALQITGMKTIAAQYLEMLEMKIKELERVKSELSADDPYYESLLLETEHWKKLFQKATWNLPQYNCKEEIDRKSSQQKGQLEEKFDKINLNEGDNATEQNEKEPSKKQAYFPVYDEDYFRVKPKPGPINKESIDRQFVVDLEKKIAPKRKTADESKCLIL